MLRFAARAAAVAAVVGAVVLLYLSLRPAAPVTSEPAAPALVQADGSVVLERKASVPAKAVKPRAKIPKGATLERQVALTVKPTEAGATANVEVDLVKLDDSTRRVVVYSDNAEVGGLDIPLDLKLDPPKTWAVGMYADPLHREAAGLFVDKDLGRLRIGAEVGRGRDGAAELRLKVGVTF